MSNNTLYYITDITIGVTCVKKQSDKKITIILLKLTVLNLVPHQHGNVM